MIVVSIVVIILIVLFVIDIVITDIDNTVWVNKDHCKILVLHLVEDKVIYKDFEDDLEKSMSLLKLLACYKKDSKYNE